jgi:hypothetical protein
MTIKQQGGIFGRNPTFNNVEADGSITGSSGVFEELLVDSNASNTTLTIESDLDGSLFYSGINLRREGTAAGVRIEADRNAAAGGVGLKIKTTANNAAETSGALTDRFSIDRAGDVKIWSGNLVIAAAGKGIDFSATAGTGTSELFDDYEEGTWTPTVTAQSGTITSSTFSGGYTIVGNTVFISGAVTITDAGTGAGDLLLTLPVAAASNNWGGGGREAVATGLSVGINGDTGKMLIRFYDQSSVISTAYSVRFSAHYTV